MDEKEINKIKKELEKVKELNKKKYNTKELAMKRLQEIGIYNSDGKLAETYRD